MIIRWTCSACVLYVCLLAFTSCQIPECFRNIPSTSSINCNGVDLTNIDSSVYDKISGIDRIISIQIRNCSIRNLDFLNSARLRTVSSLYMENIPRLTANHLDAIQTHLSESLEAFEITNCKSLTSVNNLYSNVAGTSQWKKLKTFKVGNNAIESVNPQLFKRINKPQVYDFSNNLLQTLDLSDHNAVSDVRSLLLRNNKLTSLIGLEEFPDLEVVELEGNDLTDVSGFIDTILGSDKITRVNLQNNQLERFSPSNLPQRTASTLAINLQGNRLKSVTNLRESVAKKLHVLNLKDNTGLEITNTTFTGLTNLRELDLSNCGVTEITTHFQDLPNLKTLKMSDNSITHLSNQTFSGTTKIEEMFLRGNQLSQLEFLTSQSILLTKLRKLDVSRNILENLKNFVSAPALIELQMDSNGLSELSSCLSFTKLPSTLKIVCARELSASTINDCRYRSFLTLLKDQSVVYNNDDCCDGVSCDANRSPSAYPPEKECPSKEDLCSIKPVEPGRTTTITNTDGDGRGTDGQCQQPDRAPFQDLKDVEMAVIAVGYFLAMILLIILFIMCLRRYRSYDKWLETHQQRHIGEASSSLPLQVMRKSTDTLDTVDGRFGNGSPKIGVNGTLQRQKGYGQKSFDNVSMASGYSQYSTATGKSPFMGRKKFKDANSIDIEEQSMRYISPSHRARLNSGEESPTAMSIYSYASHQPERRVPSEPNTPPHERRRHRSGGAVQRLNSGDLLELVDEDILPPKIQVVLQRRATEKKRTDAANPIGRNTRPYGTAPYRMKAKSGIVKKRTHSPLLTVSNRSTRRSGTLTPTLVKRALPDLPDSPSLGSVSSSVHSASSFISNTSKQSGTSLLKNNTTFAMDGETGESEYHETNDDIIGLG